MPNTTKTPTPAARDLWRRMKELEHSDGNWPSSDVVATLTEWFEEYGLDPDATEEPPAGPDEEPDPAAYRQLQATTLRLRGDVTEARQVARELFAAIGRVRRLPEREGDDGVQAMEYHYCDEVRAAAALPPQVRLPDWVQAL